MGERGIEYYKIHRGGETRRNEEIKRGQSGNIIDTEHIPMIEKSGGRVRVVQEEKRLSGRRR